MTRFLQKNYFWGILIVLLWGFFYLTGKHISDSLATSLLFSLLYAISIVFILYLMHSSIVVKLNTFPFKIQLALKSFLYASGIFIGYLLVKIAEILFFVSYRVWLDKTIYGFFRALTLLFTAPVSREDFGRFLSGTVFKAAASLFALLVLIALVSIIISYVETRWRKLQMERHQQEARLKTLEMQMQPHFLFNTLNSIVSVVQNDPPTAERLLISLSDFLRYNFSLADKTFVTVSEEIQFTENYIRLMNARFGGKIHWQKKVQQECLNKYIPAMFIQPIVENSIKHGWSEKSQTLQIRLECFAQLHNTVLSVEDNGTGIPPALLNNFPPKGHSLDILKQRLELLFGRNSRIEIQSDKGTQVSIVIPEKSNV